MKIMISAALAACALSLAACGKSADTANTASENTVFLNDESVAADTNLTAVDEPDGNGAASELPIDNGATANAS